MYDDFVLGLNKDKYRISEPLSKYVPLNIGGPADILYFATSVNDIIDVVNRANKFNIPITVLGGGSNTLISDNGIRGLVIINRAGDIIIGSSIQPSTSLEEGAKLVSRWDSDSSKGSFRGIEFKDLDYDESGLERISVEIDAGVSLEYALHYLLEQGITGLQWFAGIPGTIGGAIFNNIHGGTHFISEILSEVEVITPSGIIKKYSISELQVDYDRSIFHKSKYIILRGYFSMYKGDKDKAMYVAKEWANRKRGQPRNSPGSCFTNITQEQKVKLGYPTTSTGYIVEHILKMTGFRIGDAAISPEHHNFVVNLGSATAKDYLAVVREIYSRIYREVGIKVVPEILFLGFEPEDISFLYSDEQIQQRKVRSKEIKTVYKDR